jgi:hypothetical protein
MYEAKMINLFNGAPTRRDANATDLTPWERNMRNCFEQSTWILRQHRQHRRRANPIVQY